MRAACWRRRWPIRTRSSSSSTRCCTTWRASSTRWPSRAATSARRRCAAQGRDLTLVTYGGSLPKALQAAEQLAAQGIEAEVIDLRVLRPLDTETILASLRRTHRVLVVDEGWKTGSLAAEIVAGIVEHAFYELDAAPVRVCSAEVPVPYARHMEEAALPQVPAIVAAASQLAAQT
jgi:pyruvate/2-oxoglutarate/acetoin dehydrogenase E1 component